MNFLRSIELNSIPSELMEIGFEFVHDSHRRSAGQIITNSSNFSL